MRYLYLVALILPILCVNNAQAKDMNCTLSQQSDWVDDDGVSYPRDTFMMYHNASNKNECNALCRQYSAQNIEPNADSFHALGWQCFYNKQRIGSEKLK